MLGVAGADRIAALPDVPTFREQGVDFSYYFWLGLLTLASTPREVVQRLAQALRYATSNNEYQQRMRDEGSVPGTLTPEQFQDYLAKEAAQMDQLMRGLRIEKE